MNKQKYQSPTLEIHAQDTVDIIMTSGDIIQDVDPLYREIAMTYLAEDKIEQYSAYYQ